MMKAYIHRYHHPNDFEYIHPDMKPLLEETYGVMVYQEDVIKVAHHFAGLSLAEADVLRRAMSGKYRAKSEFQKIRDKFFSNCDAKGYSPEITAEVWRQIESFSGYSFSKAHSASFAVESYQSLYLKTYYPLEFMVAVINNFGGFYRTEIYVHEARRYGARIEAPCVNNSEYLTSIAGRTIFLGFVHMKNLESQLAQTLVRERKTNGPFAGLRDFLARVPLGLEQLIILIKINAFRFTGMSKKELLWEAHLLFHNNPKTVLPASLFHEHEAELSLDFSQLSADHDIENAYDQMEILGFPLLSPFEMVDWGSKLKAGISAKELSCHVGKSVTIYGYLVCIKPVRTVNGDNMAFSTFIDREGTFFDAIHFPVELKRHPLKGNGVYCIIGKVVEEFGCMNIEVSYCEKMPLLPDPRAVN
jgi:DNA polymerase-3 subunit alpha